MTRLVLLLIAAVATVVVVRLVGRVDWGEVAGALGHLAWWHVPVLVALLVLLVIRSDGVARTIGLRAGAVAARLRRTVEPEAWASACVRFREEIAQTFRRGFPRSLLALCAMLAVDLMLLVACLRLVGIPRAEVALVGVAIAYLFAYPFTLFPFSGVGIVDALVLAALVEAGGLDVEAAAVAALIVWRVFTIGGPLALGAVELAVWRRGAPEPVQG